MITACWSVKGGSGTTVVAAGLAVAQQHRSAERILLVDLAGDQPAALGSARPTGPGIAEWMAAGPSAPPDALARLETEVGPGLSLLHRGAGPLLEPAAGLLLQVLASSGRRVVVDCGTIVGGAAESAATRVAAEATRSLLVIRPCYLALQRASDVALAPSGVVVVREAGRALSDKAVAEQFQVPVVMSVDVDPAVARAVDSGLLVSRLPRRFAQVLRAVA